MKTASLRTVFAMVAIGLTAPATSFAADANSVQRYGRDSVTVWNSNFPVTPARPLRPGEPVSLGYGRAGGVQPTLPLQPHPTEAVEARHVERYGRA